MIKIYLKLSIAKDTDVYLYRSYKLFKSKPLTYLLYIAIVVNLSLVLFEEPAVPNLELHYSVSLYYLVNCRRRGRKYLVSRFVNFVLMAILKLDGNVREDGA